MGVEVPLKNDNKERKTKKKTIVRKTKKKCLFHKLEFTALQECLQRGKLKKAIARKNNQKNVTIFHMLVFTPSRLIKWRKTRKKSYFNKKKFLFSKVIN